MNAYTIGFIVYSIFFLSYPPTFISTCTKKNNSYTLDMSRSYGVVNGDDNRLLGRVIMEYRVETKDGTQYLSYDEILSQVTTNPEVIKGLVLQQDDVIRSILITNGMAL